LVGGRRSNILYAKRRPGCIQAYASYVRENEDIALSGLATPSTNEFVEIVFGGSIAIPVAAAFFGVTVTQQIAAGGSFNLGLFPYR
jgi:SNF family Na+-dependent transporter